MQESTTSTITYDSALAKVQSYTPFIPSYSYEALSQLPSFAVKFSKGKIYFGQIVNGFKHGKGVLLDDNHVYEGEFNNNRKHGNGYERFPSQNYFQGLYVNGRPEGQGKYVWANGEYYEGQWLAGKKQGQGTWVGQKGDTYQGDWKDGKPDGYGVHQWINGDRYEGSFKESLKHGYGDETFANGDRYKGFYANGKPEGQGEYFWSSGSYFKGTFKNGLRVGFGEYTSTQYCYKGFYLNDRKHGFGEVVYADGSSFKGTFCNDRREEDTSILNRTGLHKSNGDNSITPPKINQSRMPPRALTQLQSYTKDCGKASPKNQTLNIKLENQKLPIMRPPSSSERNPMATTIKKGEGGMGRAKISLADQTNRLFGRPDFLIPQQSHRNFVTRTGLKGKSCSKARSYSKAEQ